MSFWDIDIQKFPLFDLAVSCINIRQFHAGTISIVLVSSDRILIIVKCPASKIFMLKYLCDGCDCCY